MKPFHITVIILLVGGTLFHLKREWYDVQRLTRFKNEIHIGMSRDQVVALFRENGYGDYEKWKINKRNIRYIIPRFFSYSGISIEFDFSDHVASVN